MTKNEAAAQQYTERRQIIGQEYNEPFGDDPSGIKFSIVFPTRERPKLLKRVLDSINKTTKNLHEIEVLIAVDDDDSLTWNYLGTIGFQFVKVFGVKRSLNFSRDYYSYLSTISKGRWIITANDDCVFETPNWDVLAYDILKKESGIIYGWIQDGIDGYRAQGHGNYCCFPLQGRGGFEALGYIFPPTIPTWGADIWCKNLYDQIDAVVELPITLRHFCHHNKTRDQDHISKRIAENQVPFEIKPTYEEINKLIRALKNEKVKK